MKDNSALLFNKSWKFLHGDAKNAYMVNFCDSTWKNVDLPHDWVISQPFYRGTKEGWTGQNMQGFFAWEGVCWYRKEFTLNDIAQNEVYLYFGGAYRNSTVYINGKKAGGRASGYSSFEIDITDFIKEGKNVAAVRLDNGCEAPDRWYSGSGLFRNVFLKIYPVTHIKTWGVHVEPVLSANKKSAEVAVTVTVVSRDKKSGGAVCLRLLAPDGNCAAEGSVSFDCGGKEETEVKQTLRIQNPALWSAQEPNLYRAVIYLKQEGGAGEPVEVSFGVRSVEIAYNKGMTVNGEKVKLKGVCLHHESGITGSAYYDAVWRRRLNILKALGCNAIRTSHNPPAEEFLDLCDELGFYVIDECFDKWKSGYYAAHFDEDAQRDLTDFILRDRNHPCVFMWSVGNEVENQGADSMLELQKKLTAIVRSIDSRPVTCALAPHAVPRTLVNEPPQELAKLTKKLAKDVDVLGLNYHEPLYEYYIKSIEKPIVGTECYEYYSSVGTNYEDVCDKNTWQYVLENENVIGQFIWAGIDYLGESPWPSKGWSGSILDICGFMKPNAFFRKSLWTDEPFVYMAFYDQYKKTDYTRGRWSFPQLTSHLNHEHFLRSTVKIAIFTTCDEVELWINAKKMGRRKRADFKNGIVEWTIEYAQGNIEVKGINNGKEACSHILKTADKAQKIKLISDNANLKAGEIAHIEINVTDKNGILCPNEELIEFSLEGDAEFLGACSGDLTQNLGFTKTRVVTFEGRALAMIKAGAGSGNIALCAYNENLEKASLRFKVK
ncbi:glycoside hydrolase family 2 TIM barrel-domain containing protein [Treponema sp. R80B11-R83G3]